MQVVKIIFTVMYFIVCLAIIVLAMIQSKQDEGLSSTIMGSSANSNFVEKNRGNTREGKQRKWTVIFGIILVAICIGLGTIYPL